MSEWVKEIQFIKIDSLLGGTIKSKEKTSGNLFLFLYNNSCAASRNSWTVWNGVDQDQTAQNLCTTLSDKEI